MSIRKQYITNYLFYSFRVYTQSYVTTKGPCSIVKIGEKYGGL